MASKKKAPTPKSKKQQPTDRLGALLLEAMLPAHKRPALAGSSQKLPVRARELFASELAELACQAEESNQVEPVAMLLELAEGIEQSAFGGLRNVTVVVAPSDLTVGQRYKIIVTCKNLSDGYTNVSNDVILRVYVPNDVYPVVIEFDNMLLPMRCNDREELVGALKEVLRSEEFQLRLKSLRKLAT